MTHGHVDHVGALDKLFALYPDIKVVIHEAEEDFIAGPNQYFASKSESWQHAALRLFKISPRQEFKVSSALHCSIIFNAHGHSNTAPVLAKKAYSSNSCISIADSHKFVERILDQTSSCRLAACIAQKAAVC